MANKNEIEWIDLSAHGAKLSVLRFPDGRTRVVLTGIKDGSSDWLWAESIGFQPSPNRLSLFTNDTRVSFSRFLTRFPMGKRVLMPRNHVIRVVSQDIKSIKTEVELREARPLGLNHLGQQVFEGAAGRFIRATDDGQPVTETETQSPAIFLRATSANDLALCADGLVESMVRGEILRADDLKRFASVVYGLPDQISLADTRLRDVQEAIEAAMQRRLEKSVALADDEAFQWAVALIERQPPFIYRTSTSVENQQYSTPLPLAVAAQRILGDTAGKRVLEPTIGNGSLISLLPSGTELFGYEIDPKRVDQVSRLRDDLLVKQGDYTQTPLTGNFDAVIANPPFGGLHPAQDINGLRVTRLDHLILMKSLSERAPDGRAVYIIAADRDNLIAKNAGKLCGGSKSLFNWLADHYELEGVAEVDGRLYEKQGAGYPVRIVVVGRRRSPEEAAQALKTKQYRLPETVPVLRSWDEVWEFARTHAPRAESELHVENQVAAAAEPETRRQENSYQAPYVPSSKIGEGAAMIPRNMQAPVSKALNDLEKKYGAVDEFVANKLQMSESDLAAAFSPEQVDAIALAIARVDEKRGFIVGDMTGLGKGRIMAAMARYAVLEGRHVVFLTEKPNLFSDLWRDINDICVDRDPKQLFKPFILNDGVGIRDENNHSVFPATKKDVVKKIVDANDHPSSHGYNITFATYSQFNRDVDKSAKSAWISQAASESLLLLDESHNAAGESNTAENIARAVSNSWGCVYSSATFAKNAKNLAAYSKVFPSSVPTGELADILAAGGEPLMEILSANLAEDGAMIRREHDFSNLVFETLEDKTREERNRSLSDQLSKILLAMSYMSGDVEELAKRLNKEMQQRFAQLGRGQRAGKRMGVSSINFGSRLYNILRQFQLAIKVDLATEEAIKQLQAGRKPVIVTEQTFESLLAETLFQNVDIEEKGESEGESASVKLDAEIKIKPLTFRDVLYRMLDKIDTIVERDDYGHVTRTSAIEKAQNPEEAQAWMRAKSSVRAMIDEFPDLPVSPIDIIREKIEASGYKCSEISGRGMIVRSTPDGMMVVEPRVDDRLKTIHAFNNGALDAVVLTRAGSTGISLHASEKFEDKRQRVMIELQIPNNVAERMQFFGRVNRKGQVSHPIIQTLSSGIPSEVRILAMQNNKLRKLSANTQSNRENVAESRDIPDVINPLGNEIAYRFLENNPTVARLLDIDMDEENLTRSDDYFINKLMGRIALLPISEQQEALDLVTAEFESALSELESIGENPFKAKEYAWGAREVSRIVFDGAENENARVFDRPVYMSEIEWFVTIDPMRWDTVSEMIGRGIQDLQSDGRIDRAKEPDTTEMEKDVADRIRDAAYKDSLGIDVSRLQEMIKKQFEPLLAESLASLSERTKGEINTLGQALSAKEPNPVKNLHARMRFIFDSVELLKPGRMISFANKDGEFTKGVVVAMRLPEDRHLHLAGQYSVAIAVPGAERAEWYTFNALMQHGVNRVHEWEYSRPDQKAFDSAPAGQARMSRIILHGNLFKAAQIAMTQKLGRSGIYIDADGQRRRAIICSNLVTMDVVQAIKPRMPTVAIAEKIIRENPRILFIGHPTARPDEVPTIRTVGQDEYQLSVPGTRQEGGRFFLDKELLALTGDFAGNRSVMSVNFSGDILTKVLGRMYMISDGFYAPPEMRDRINEMMRQSNKTKDPDCDLGMAA